MGRRRRFRAPAPFPRRAHDSQGRRRPGLTDRRTAQTTGKGRPGRRNRIHRRQAGARGRRAAGELRDPPHPRERRPGAPRTRETPQGVVHEVRGVPARRTAAVGLHPLADRHGSGSRGRLPARRPLPQPAARACVRHGDDGRRAGHVPSGVRRTRHPRQDAHRQRHRIHHQTDQRRPGAFRTHARADGRAPEQRTALPPPDAGQDRTLPPRPEAMALRPSPGVLDRRAQRTARRITARLQRGAAAPRARPANPRRSVPRQGQGPARPRTRSPHAGQTDEQRHRS